MSEIVLSSFLSVLFENLASATLQNLHPSTGIDSELNKLHRSLSHIQNVLADASRKEITNQSVKQWLIRLQHLAYEIDDILDDLATESMHRELTDESETLTSKVRKFFKTTFSKHSVYTRSMKDKINDVRVKLEELVEDKATLGLIVKEEIGLRNVNRRLQTSMVDVSSIVGRKVEKEALVRRLLMEPSERNFSVVPIVGMGGVGKTTLARLLYDEKQVKDYFKVKAWVCVSDEFDSFGISKVVFQSVAGVNKEFADLNLLQVDLRNHLREKRFLLVLDDVWSESCEDWETLVGPFHVCAPGSKIIVTTRKTQLLSKLGYNHLNQQLQRLSDEDALSLVAIHALGVNNFDSHLSLKAYGEGIVKKCDGLPLALIALGRLLRTKKYEDEYWDEVLNSEIWRLHDGDGIVPALRLSYYDLSAHLKQLFAYCSLFPKGFMFDKNELVLLWIAEGFLRRSTSSESTLSDTTEERLGHECFDELLSRSFFQHAPNNKSVFVMHDLMNDLATFVASEFFLRFDNEMEKVIQKKPLENYHHMSFVREHYGTYKKFKAFTRAKSLRTFMATSVGVVESWQSFYFSNKVLADLLLELPLLRVLSLSNYQISEVPESIGTLKHLRYLNLSRTRIAHLPETVCNLYNLQILIVFGCDRLTKLPHNFSKLKNMRHLDIRDTPLLDQMPLGIGEFKNLQTLSKVIIGGESGFEITKLKDLKNLGGKIYIAGLEKVQNPIHAREANFSQKRLSELEVVWSDVPHGSRNEMLEKEVLNELKPSNDKLIQLKIWSYGGIKFPSWVGDPLFLHLKHVSIHGCKKCTSLPPLGQLPSLKELFIGGLDEVKIVDMELLGTAVAFPSLEILSFQYMQGWEKWSMNGGVIFPCLQELHIKDCPNLVKVVLETLPSLNVLKIARCESGVLRKLVQAASLVTELEIEYISGLNDVVWRDIIKYLRAVEDLSITKCNEIRYLWESEAVVDKVLVKLRNLKVNGCGNLLSLEEKEEDNCRGNLLTSLRMLDVSHCDNLRRCSCPYSIDTLKVCFCNSVTTISFPTEGHQLKSLDIICCNKLLETEWGGQNINKKRSSMPMLEIACIYSWPNLKSVIALDYFLHLTTLSIVRCESLESFPDTELTSLTNLKELFIINCPSMDASFPRGFWPPKLHSLEIGKLKKPISEWGPQNFPASLVQLSLYGDDGVSSCNQFSHLLPPSLTSLEITEFEKLESFSTGLQHLPFLQHLSFDICPNMMDLPETLLPSLLSLTIWDCPILKERCSKGGSYWPIISHIPCIDI